MEQNLSLYRIFYTVAGAGNISKAARELYISQPAISKAIGKLEDSLSTTLFLRNSRGVTLTPEGRILYEHVSAAFETLSRGEEELLRIQELGIGHIRLGVSTTLCKYILLPHLKDFIAENPHIKITVENQASAQTLSMLEQQQIDIGLIARPKNLKNIRFHSVVEIQDTFVCTPSYLENLRLREGSDASLFESGTVMLLNQNNMTRQHIDRYLTEQLIEIPHPMEISTMDLLIEFARIGLGIGCCIRECVQQDLDAGHLVEIPVPGLIPKRLIGLALPASPAPLQATEKFLEFMKASAALQR